MKKIKQFIHDIFHTDNELMTVYLDRMKDFDDEREIICKAAIDRAKNNNSELFSFTEVEIIKLDIIRIKQSLLSNNIGV